MSSITSSKSMTIADLLETYVASNSVGRRYRESLLRTVRKAQASGLEKICQLEPKAVNAMLAGLCVGDTTRANIRRELLTLWRFAYEQQLTEVFPARIARIRSRQQPPQAWSRDELQALLSLAASDETRLGGKSAARVCDILPAWIGIAYDTGLRFADVLALKAANVRNGCVTTTAAKTGKPLVRRMSPSTCRSVAATIKKSPDGTVFAWALTRRRAFHAWRGFLNRHHFSGSSKFLRRSCATYVESQTPGGATLYLQHSHPQLASKHYIDQTLIAAPAGPPALEFA